MINSRPWNQTSEERTVKKNSVLKLLMFKTLIKQNSVHPLKRGEDKIFGKLTSRMI